MMTCLTYKYNKLYDNLPILLLKWEWNDNTAPTAVAAAAASSSATKPIITLKWCCLDEN